MAFVCDLFLSLTAKSSTTSSVFGVCYRPRNVAVQRRRSGFVGVTSSTHVLAHGIAVSMDFPQICIYGSSGWASVMVLVRMRLKNRVQVLGSLFVLLGRRTVDGNPEVSQRGRSLALSLDRARKK